MRQRRPAGRSRRLHRRVQEAFDASTRSAQVSAKATISSNLRSISDLCMPTQSVAPFTRADILAAGAHLRRPQVLCAHAKRRAVHAKRMFSWVLSQWDGLRTFAKPSRRDQPCPEQRRRVGVALRAGAPRSLVLSADLRSEAEESVDLPAPLRPMPVLSHRDAARSRVEGIPTTSPCFTLRHSSGQASKETSLSAQRRELSGVRGRGSGGQ